MIVPKYGLLTFKTLDEHIEWQLKYRHWLVDIAEVEQEVFVCLEDLAAIHSGMPKIKDLKLTHRRVIFYVKYGRRHFISESGLRRLIQATVKGHQHAEALKFLDFIERNVIKQSVKKHDDAQQSESNKLQHALASTVKDGPLQQAVSSPRWDVPTLPANEAGLAQALPPELSWVQPIPADMPLARLTLREWLVLQANSLRNSVGSFWYGYRNLFATLMVGLFVGFYPVIQLEALVPEDLDWAVHYRWVLWWNVLVLVMALAAAVWFGVSMTRSMLRTCRTAGGFIWGLVVYFLAIPLLFSIAFQSWSLSLLEEWWDTVAGRYRPAQVHADPFLGRVVVTGPLLFGSSMELEKVLDANRKYTLVQIESPGGYVVEGMRMAKLVSDRKLDMVSLDHCESACTLILASGVDRYLGPKAEVGFHRSGYKYGPISDGWSPTDHEMAKLLRSRGVEDAFINKAFIPSIRDIWYPQHGEMFAAGYATLKWSERKFGY